MTFEEAQAAIAANDGYEITVRSRSGAEYAVAWDTIECYGEDGYVYGYRTNGVTGGPFRKGTQGNIRWFDLKNVTLVTS